MMGLMAKLLRAFAPVHAVRSQDYALYENRELPKPLKTFSAPSALLADGDVTLSNGVEMREEDITALKHEILQHDFGNSYGL